MRKKKDLPVERAFFHMIRAHGKDLVVLNLIYLFFCIPLVTIGPATVALYNVTCDLVRNRPVSVWDCFARGWKENWRSGVICGSIFIPLLLTALVTIFLFAFQAPEDPVRWLVVVLSSLLLVTVTAVGNCLFPLLLTVRMPVIEAIRYSFILLTREPGSSLLLALSTIIWISAIILLMPYSMAAFLLAIFSLPAMGSSLVAWRNIQKYVIKEND